MSEDTPEYKPFMDPAIIHQDLREELWREYVLIDGTVYRINDPQTLYYKELGTTHRVLDGDGVVHCLPKPGNGSVLRWKPRNGDNPVQF